MASSNWKKRSEAARKTFNALYSLMMDNPELFTHPKAPQLKPVHWKTVAWNAAWIAADAVDESIPDAIFDTNTQEIPIKKRVV